VSETRQQRIRRFRERAEAAREQAAQMRNCKAIETMQDAAAFWDAMAEHQQRRLSRDLSSTLVGDLAEFEIDQMVSGGSQSTTRHGKV
jgi:hypothetical protein